jgi:hypothetical protein
MSALNYTHLRQLTDSHYANYALVALHSLTSRYLCIILTDIMKTMYCTHLQDVNYVMHSLTSCQLCIALTYIMSTMYSIYLSHANYELHSQHAKYSLRSLTSCLLALNYIMPTMYCTHIMSTVFDTHKQNVNNVLHANNVNCIFIYFRQLKWYIFSWDLCRVKYFLPSQQITQ